MCIHIFEGKCLQLFPPELTIDHIYIIYIYIYTQNAGYERSGCETTRLTNLCYHVCYLCKMGLQRCPRITDNKLPEQMFSVYGFSSEKWVKIQITNILTKILKKYNEFVFIFLFFGVNNLYFNKYFVVLLCPIQKGTV